MKFLKHIIFFAVLITLLLPLITPLILELKQVYVQLEMKEALEEKELTTLTIPSKQIQWIKKGKECFINGEMFDVKNILTKGDDLILTGLFDTLEKAIEEHIRDLSKEQNSSKQNSAIVKLFSISAYISEPIQIPVPSITFIAPSFQLYTKTYNTPTLSIIAPPPRC
jgi:hypothetical protein